MLAQPAAVVAAGRPSVIVQGCGCCLGWVRHIQKSGFVTDLRETKDLDSIKQRLRIPPDLTACHTAEIAGYVVEGHVPAAALNRLLTEKPKAIGIAEGAGVSTSQRMPSAAMPLTNARTRLASAG